MWVGVGDREGREVAAAWLAEGVMGRAVRGGESIGFGPPLCLTRAEADEIAGRMGKAVDAVF